MQHYSLVILELCKFNGFIRFWYLLKKARNRSQYMLHEGMYYKRVIISCSFVYELAVSSADRMFTFS